MPNALDSGRTTWQPLQGSGTASRFLAGVIDPGIDRNRRETLDTMHKLNLIAIRLGEDHPVTTTRLINFVNDGCSLDQRCPLEISFACNLKCKPYDLRLALLSHMDVMIRVSAAHV
ncbi:hypothetical protein BG60_18385 [Caballeronia zhejiangensis]|uniref:Uncharacterized protein n=1 Tax=Caballeronia zhejiangensis TaxID=871203 RepID=A0A656QEX6_9BURK|nr:hypothetical protein BG60_18385 [Caballeronia zhejiangensis]